MSYLNGSYLSSDDLGADGATMALMPAPGEAGSQGEDLIALPGGIMIPRKTLWIILGALAVAGAIIYLRKRERRLARLEHAVDEDE